jgi:predicted nuclease of predicted toxin-antitoxin system
VKLVADECCDAVLVAGLRSDGHDVLYVKEAAPGADDGTVLRLAFDQERLLLTEDKDFGELVVRLGLPARGIILMRVNPAHTNTKLARFRAVASSAASRVAGCFTVIDEKKTRFRPLPSS